MLLLPADLREAYSSCRRSILGCVFSTLTQGIPELKLWKGILPNLSLVKYFSSDIGDDSNDACAVYLQQVLETLWAEIGIFAGLD